MWVRCTGWLLIVAAALTTARAADDAGAASPEIFQQACNQAMPDLLSGEIRGLVPVLQLAPANLKPMETAIYAQWSEATSCRQDWGKPIDWKGLGVKRISTAIREYLYVCRYTNVPVLWSFTALEHNGRWSLIGVNWNPGAPAIVEQLQTGATKDGTCVHLCDRIADMLAHKRQEVGTLIADNSMYLKQSERAQSLLDSARFVETAANWGEPLRWELISATDTGGIVGEYSYFLQWDREIAFFRFYLYRAGKNWKICNVRFENAHPTLLKTAMEPLGAVDVPVTAETPKTTTKPLVR